MDITRVIPEALLSKIRAIYTVGDDNYRILLATAGSALSSVAEVAQFQDLLHEPSFREYLAQSRSFARGRFEKTIDRICGVITSGKPNAKIKDILSLLNSKEYIEAFHRYFFQPIEPDLYQVFEGEVFRIALKDKALAPAYFRLSNEGMLRDIKSWYEASYPNSYRYFLDLLTLIVMFAATEDDAVQIAGMIVSRVVRKLVQVFEAPKIFDLKDFDRFFSGLFQYMIARDHKHRKMLQRILHDTLRFLILPVKNPTHRKLIALKVLAIIRVLGSADVEHFSLFMQTFPYKKDSPEEMLWEVIFECEPKSVAKYLEFFTSVDFRDFFRYYATSFDTVVLKFLLRNIFICLGENVLSNFPKSLYMLVLNLLLRQKMDRSYVRRRTEFMTWVGRQNRSRLLEAFFVRYLFYEYIFIYRSEFEKEKSELQFTRFCDPFHEAMCRVLDDECVHTHSMEERQAFYSDLYREGREKIWQPVKGRFPLFHHEIEELKGICASLDCDDVGIRELMSLDAESFGPYFVALRTAIEMNPSNREIIMEAFQHDFWCRVLFEEAQYYILRTVMPVAGNFPIRPDPEKNLAYTDGATIFLPQWIAYFPDSRHDLDNNRNVTMYVGLALHEAGHILGGSFKFDMSVIIHSYEFPMLYKDLFNVFEDYRIEAYLGEVLPPGQTAEIFHAMNVFLAVDIFSDENTESVIVSLLCYFSSAAADTWPDMLLVKPELRELVDKIMELGFPSGRFPSLRAFSEYVIDRLRFMDIRNPFAAHRLADEAYQVFCRWPKEQFMELGDRHGLFRKMQGDEGGGETTSEGRPGEKRKVLSREDLDELYRLCDSDPRAFYESNGMPYFGDQEKGKEKGEGSGRIPSPLERIMDTEAEGPEIDYEVEGTFDAARRTRLDDEVAEEQLKGKSKKADPKAKKKEKDKSGVKPKPKPKKDGRVKRILSYNPKTRTRSLLAECREYTMKTVEPEFLAKNRAYDPIVRRINEMLYEMIESRSSNAFESSSLEGDVDMERLIEILADPNNERSPEFLEVPVENRRSLKVVIGLDISGSTEMLASKVGEKTDPKNPPMTVLDVEKHFALIFAKALKPLTREVEVYAFNSETSTNIYRADPIEAVTSFKSAQSNRDGDFVRYVTEILKDSKCDIKYFFFTSDGMPVSVNYEGKDAMDDTLLAMRECRKAGIRLVYFNIDSSLKPYFLDFQKEALYAKWFSDPKQIMQAIPEMMLRIAKEVV